MKGFLGWLFGQPDPIDADEEAPEFRELLEASAKGLKLQTESHARMWGLGMEERWNFAQDSGELVFSFPQRIVRAPGQIIGTLNQDAGTWKWAWANETIAVPLVRDSVVVREYGREHGVRRLVEPAWACQEMEAWETTALACRLCNASGAYRGSAGRTLIFFTFREVRIHVRA